MKTIVSVFLILGLVGGCAYRESLSVIDGKPGSNGKDGSDGVDGKNGHSIVSQYLPLEQENLECLAGGSRLDMYLDLDDSLSVSEEDVYQGSLVACNGLNGLAGRDGVDGANGVDGKDGASGEDGEDGEDGQDGEQGIAGEPGSAGPPGEAGPQGAPGPAGIPGPIGPQGPQGPQGIAGTPGSSVTITVYAVSSCTAIAGTIYYVKTDNIYSNSTCSSSQKVAELTGGDDTFWVSANKLATEAPNNSIRVINFN